MKPNKIKQDYFKILLSFYIIIAAFRLLETALVFSNFGNQESLFKSEVIGFIYDIITVNAFLLIFYPIYSVIYRKSKRIADWVFVALLIVASILHFIILKYFLYQLLPLDSFLYQYSLIEIIYTLKTSGTSYSQSGIFVLMFIVLVFLSYKFIQKKGFSKGVISIATVFVFVSLPIFMFLEFSNSLIFNRFTTNKAIYFYSRSISYLFKADTENESYSNRDATDYQNLFPDRTYLSTKYPLLHEFNNQNVLGQYFNKFDSAPNIVILIVEGLNDDFVHPYRGGVNLMPFLTKLKDKSLYWSSCFTLGERSFAVVPSVLGSLPYGEKGFTLLDRLPRHLSLVSILKANDYHTSFFYGQGSWFHKKDRFFKYNNSDLIFDNTKFSEKYRKIIVGADNFFWGYNDKDLFNQSFEVLDTLTSKKRLDIYFTGTSHSPYIIADHEHYENQMSEIIKSLKNPEDVEFYKTYKRYLLSIFFVNDALEGFFKKYQERQEYKNSIFIITGDHPTTEIPVGNSLKRYHVPLIIYSPRLKIAQTFSKTVSHLDIYESVLSILSDYDIKIPKMSSALGGKLKVDEKEGDVKIAFMNDNREIVDYLSNNYYISGKQLYKVSNNLSITPCDDKKQLDKLQNELKIFKKTSLHTSIEDKIVPDSLFCKYLGYGLIYSEQNRKDSLKFSSEFYNLINSTPINSNSIYYDISFNYSGQPDDQLTLAYQISTAKDSIVFWANSGITYENNSFQMHIKIPKQKISDTRLYFKSYFWNKNKKSFRFSNLKILLYAEGQKTVIK